MTALLTALALGLAAVLLAPVTHATIQVSDDAGAAIKLNAPARRIVSLAPHATEMLFAAGAGAQIVGVVQHSDYPPPALDIASVGSGVALDLERIVHLKPDLVVAWRSGNSATQIGRLRQLGIPVYESEPRDYPGIAHSIERLAQLAGTEAVGQAAANSFRLRLAQLEASYKDRRVLTVFYQIWRAPLMTLNGEHMVSQALRLCGAQNIFGMLPQIAPTVSTEAVVMADPDVIIASSGEQDDVLADWRRFSTLKAVARANLLLIDGTVMNRAGPRVLDGTEMLCRQLDGARARQ
jgi:iron complex transport system substrate-binding protein